MGSGAWRMVIAIVLLAHGIGHVLGLFPLVGLARLPGWHNRTWLLGTGAGNGVAKVVAPTLWSVALVGFVLVGLGVVGIGVQGAVWRTLAIVAAVVSMLAVAVFWNGFPTLTSKVGAIAVDVALLWWLVQNPSASVP